MLLTEALYLLGLLLIQLGRLVARPMLCMQQLIELTLQGLRVAMLRTLDDERHGPGRQGRGAVPVEAFAVEQNPEESIAQEKHESAGPRRQCAGPSEHFA